MRRFGASSCKAAPKGHTFISYAAPLRRDLHHTLLRVLDTTVNGHPTNLRSGSRPRQPTSRAAQSRWTADKHRRRIAVGDCEDSRQHPAHQVTEPPIEDGDEVTCL